MYLVLKREKRVARGVSSIVREEWIDDTKRNRVPDAFDSCAFGPSWQKDARSLARCRADLFLGFSKVGAQSV